MQVYFYCSYEHSQSGFFLTRLEGNALVPGESGSNPPPDEVRSFFSYDRFRFLWRDLCRPSQRLFQGPQCTGSFCGVRELRGRMADGRPGVANLAMLAGPEEAALLRRTALSILGDYNAFETMLFGCLSAGGACGYQLKEEFSRWLQRCGQAGQLRRLVPEDDPAARLLPLLQGGKAPRAERDTLHLAACTSTWDLIAESMGTPGAWKKRPKQALDDAAFCAAFLGRGPLWEMT